MSTMDKLRELENSGKKVTKKPTLKARSKLSKIIDDEPTIDKLKKVEGIKKGKGKSTMSTLSDMEKERIAKLKAYVDDDDESALDY